MEVVDKRVNKKKGKNYDVGDVRIVNVLIPPEEKRRYYNLLAKKTVKKCGIRPLVAYYPVPPEVGKDKIMVPYFLLCVARFREKIIQRWKVKE